MGEDKRVFAKHTSLGTIEREMSFTKWIIHTFIYCISFKGYRKI